MKANELRIGNYIQYPNLKKPIRVSIIDTTQTDKDTKAKPIPLTEEWLLNFGLEYFEGWDDMIFYRENNWEQKNDWFELHKTLQGFIFEDFRSQNIKYVHSLQNLFFALTGEELTLKTT